jgi:hypothetical protein
MRATLVVSFWRCAARCGRRYAADGELAPSAIVFINLTELAPAKPFSPPRSYRALTGVAWPCDHDQSMWVLDGTRCKGGDKRDDQQHAPGLPATLFHPWPAAAHVAQVPEHVGERSSGTNAGKWCV